MTVRKKIKEKECRNFNDSSVPHCRLRSGEQERSNAPPGGQSLKNKKKELFCRFYAFQFWGNAEKAFQSAGFGKDSDGGNADHRRSDPLKRPQTAKELLESEEIRKRIAFLRKVCSELSIADEAWIKENLIAIAESAEKEADRIRALANLNMLIRSHQKNVLSAAASAQEEEDFGNGRTPDETLPFEGNPDGFAGELI